MLQSQLFTKTSRNFPKDEEAINAKYLIKGGFVAKISSGVYAILPLGWRVLNKINNIVREEMNVIGAQELFLPALIAKKYWEKSGRWGTDIMYKLTNPKPETRNPKPDSDEFGLGWTHEEVVADLANHFINSEKDLPKAVYQIQTKFRNEPRAKNGLLRGREFLMKDLYSFHTSEDDLKNYYQTVIGAYKKIFDRLNLSYKITEASGGAFTKEYTHEFQILNSAGEDNIFYCDKCDFSQNQEIAPSFAKASEGKESLPPCPQCGGEIQESKGIEVANVFKLGNRFSKWQMGSYGFGPTRVMGALVEIFHDDKGIIWPDSVAPFQAHLLALPGAKNTDKIYQNLLKAGVEILYDDRALSAGEKFADADLLGIPHRLVGSEKTGDKIEIKRRGLGESRLVNMEEIIKIVK